MLTLIKQEAFKLFHRIDFYIYIALIALATLGLGLMEKSNLTGKTWFANLGGQPGAISEIIFVIAMFVVILAITLVVGEFTNGTARNLLDRKYSRLAVLISKLITIVYITLIFLATEFVVSFLIAKLMFVKANINGQDIKTWLLGAMGIFFYITLITAISLVIGMIFKNEGAAIAVGVAVVFGNTIIFVLLRHLFKYVWFRWLTPLLFLQINSLPSMYTIKYFHMTVPSMVLGSVIWTLIFYVILYLIFSKRDA